MTQAEKAEVLAYKISVLNNLAICSRKMHQLNLAIQGHSDVLEVRVSSRSAHLPSVAIPIMLTPPGLGVAARLSQRQSALRAVDRV